MEKIGKYNLESQIRVECNNWYEIENDLIKVCLRNGSTILLNPKFKQLWLEIGYGCKLSELWDKVKSNILEKDFINIIDKLSEVELINVIQPEDEFDSIFN